MLNVAREARRAQASSPAILAFNGSPRTSVGTAWPGCFPVDYDPGFYP
jgi:hypothetical protein